VTHDQEEALTMADRLVVMSEGRIVHETPAATADRHELGAYMGGGHH